VTNITNPCGKHPYYYIIMADIFYQHQKRHPAAFYNCGMPFSY
jgi:hypothetical protein